MPSLVTYMSPALSSATPPGERRKSIPVNGSTDCPDAGFAVADEGRVTKYPVIPTAATSRTEAAPTMTHRLRFRPDGAAPSAKFDGRAEPASDGGGDPRQPPPLPPSGSATGRATVS